MIDQFQLGDPCESEVEDALKSAFFPTKVQGIRLKISGKVDFLRKFVPNSDSTPARVVTPRPDIVYGYHTGPYGPFLNAQNLPVEMWKDISTVNNFSLAFPFLVVEIKAEGHVNGNPWVAMNQCLGGSTTCVNVVHQLNQLLMEYPGAKPIDDVCFGIAMDQRTATLFVAWKGGELKYNTRAIAHFLLICPEHFIRLRKMVKNIVDWGANERLKGIQGALDFLVEEIRKAGSSAAKCRTPPEASKDADRASKRTRRTKG